MNYRYILDKTSKKYRCTKCTKQTLVKFIDTQTGEVMSNDFGRCDRETKCGFLNIPKSKSTSSYKFEYKPPIKTSYHDYNLVTQSGKKFKQNNFIQFIKKRFGIVAAKTVINRYLIGTSNFWNGATVFWQIDNNQKVRHGKIMLYNTSTCKRKKNTSGKAYISSVRSVLKLNTFNLKQCLFGLHLVNESKIKTVGLVESEKTAILMSIFRPQYIWMATGSKSGFKYEYLKPIKHCSIIAFPDKSEYACWLNKAIELNGLGFNIKVSEFLENTNCADGTDLADLLLQTNTDVLLECETNTIKNETKQKVEVLASTKKKQIDNMALRNPNIKKLVDVFSLMV